MSIIKHISEIEKVSKDLASDDMLINRTKAVESMRRNRFQPVLSEFNILETEINSIPTTIINKKEVIGKNG